MKKTTTSFHDTYRPVAQAARLPLLADRMPLRAACLPSPVDAAHVVRANALSLVVGVVVLLGLISSIPALGAT